MIPIHILYTMRPPRQGLMYQQQELYRHQQDALARLQEEAERLRQETLELATGGRSRDWP